MKKTKKIVISIIVVFSLLVTVGGCSKSKETKESSESKTSKVTKDQKKESSSFDSVSRSKDDKKQSSKPSSSKVSSQTSVAKNETQTTGTSSEVASTPSTEQAVDTKNLTTEQVKKWVFENLQVNNKERFTQNDYIFDMGKGDNGELEIDVRENHSTPAMKAAGTDEETVPRIASFKIDSAGNLLRSDDAGITYQKVSDHFTP